MMENKRKSNLWSLFVAVFALLLCFPFLGASIGLLLDDSVEFSAWFVFKIIYFSICLFVFCFLIREIFIELKLLYVRRPSYFLIASAILLVGGTILFCGVGSVIPSNDRDNRNPKKKIEMMQITLLWGGLAPFPDSAKDFVIKTQGNNFTRRFAGSFNDSSEVIRKWLQNSPGVQEGRSEVLPDKSTRYLLKTREGASYGEVIISSEGTHVEFKVEWS
jgi:hypothetical protein